MDIAFILNSMLLGVGLAMDAFCVSMANGMNEPHMRGRRIALVAGTYGTFQFLMPMIGWVCVHTIVQAFSAFEVLVPWIALGLLSYIGGKMVVEGLRGDTPDESDVLLAGKVLLMQGIATSIDALSVGFTIAEYDLAAAVVCALIIAVETFAICTAGVHIGRVAGTKLAGRATIFGGLILVAIGIEIFVSNVFLG